MKYIIISPVRNEEKYIEKTINSVILQSAVPSEWIIVNDGSNDRTKDIVESRVSTKAWIKIVDKEDRGFTEVGRGVMETFYWGIKNIQCDDWDIIVKLDCDIELESNYFEMLLKRFNENKQLGIAGGTSYVPEKGRLYVEKMPEYYPWAGARAYRRKCFDDINGLIVSLGWDIVDIIKAQMKEWETKRFEDLRIIHLRRMSSRRGLWEGKVRTGRNFYITGYHPLFLIARSFYRLLQRPFLIESLGVMYGYYMAMIKKEKLIVTEEEKRFFQVQQLRRLIEIGK